MYTEITNAAAENECPEGKGQLPGRCAAMAFPFVAMQGQDLPFHKELKSRVPAANTALSELMALDFAIDELGLYLVTHAEDQEVLALYWEFIRLAQEGRARYEAQYGPLTQTTVTEGGYRWLKDPWPWDEGGSD